MQLITLGYWLENSTLLSGTTLENMANSQGIPCSGLFVEMSDAGLWRMIPLATAKADPGWVDQAKYTLYIAFTSKPPSEVGGNYSNVGEILWYLQNPQITGITSLRQLLGM